MPVLKTEDSPLQVLIIQMTSIYYTLYKSKSSFQRHMIEKIEHYIWLNIYTYIPLQNRIYVVKERISIFSWNGLAFQLSHLTWHLTTLFISCVHNTFFLITLSAVLDI
jgi:hypothetical protein